MNAAKASQLFRQMSGTLHRVGGGVRSALRSHRAPLDLGFLKAVRSQSHAASSDAELRNAVSRLSDDANLDSLLAAAFAVVDEAVSRRLGAWRLMDPTADIGPMAHFRAVADRILQEGPYRHIPAYYTDDGFASSARFGEAVDAALSRTDLDADERVIVKTLVQVAERSKVEHWWDILLPAEFYRAVAPKDTTGAVQFSATDEQILAGRLLFEGKVVEMSAGEGKTVAGAFAAVAYTLAGRSVHVITANDYLAERDHRLLAPVYESLGLASGVVLGHMSDDERRPAYRRKIVYGTVREIGFDFLRDNLKDTEDELVLGPMDAAIVDEADHSLIDEARTPLIIAGGSRSRPRSLQKVRRAVGLLVDRHRRTVAELEAAVREHSLSGKERVQRVARLMLADPASDELAGAFGADGRLYRHARSLAESVEGGGPDDALVKRLEYTLDRDGGSFALTERGERYLESYLGPLFDTTTLDQRFASTDSRPRLALVARRREAEMLRRRVHRQHNRMNHVYQMLRAFILMRRDVDYIVTEGEVVLVDGETGRRRPDSRYQDGLQAAIEAKEGVLVHADSSVLAEISVQGMMALYLSVSGMTGTARQSATEFRKAYGVDVAAVPPSVPSRRVDLPTRLYESRDDKLSAVVNEVQSWHAIGRPVLIGTLTVEQSEAISRRLTDAGVGHRLLNAVNSADEAKVVSSAGNSGAVTVATNMAGRGTDILLEPGLDGRITQRCVRQVSRRLAAGATRVEVHCATAEEAVLLERALSATAGLSISRFRTNGNPYIIVAEHVNGQSRRTTRSLDFGLGLHVIGTEMNGSRRVDDQLRGRTGRQGDFGSTRFLLSFEDEALASPAGMRRPFTANRHRDSSGRSYYEGKNLERRLERVQALMEQEDEAARALALDYTRVLEHVTLAYYRARRRTLGGVGLTEAVAGAIDEAAREIVEDYLPVKAITEYRPRFDALAERIQLDYGVDCGPLFGLGVEALAKELGRRMALKFWAHLGMFDATARGEALRSGVLHIADEFWATYLSEAHEAMLNAQVCAWGHSSAVAEFMRQAAEAYRRFEGEALRSFVPRFLKVTPFCEDNVQESRPHAVEELEKILA